mgnify:CR=1 FL=1|tara:strand:- start:16721 stop:17707 length:987 start_codon:yes stop_codon:yes gene_type:complete
MSLLEKEDRIFVAGSTGMVGSAICRLLKKNGYSEARKNLLTSSRVDLDCSNKLHVEKWFKNKKPEVVIIAAAKVGGIMANMSQPVNFLLENLKIQNNLIETSWKFGVKRLVFLGSSCIYPKSCIQPIKESYLLNSNLESSNQWYAIAKIAGLKLCEAFKTQYDFDTISLMPTNLYGPNDNYDLNQGHVMAALIRKFHEAKMNNDNKVVCWGSGTPLREFLYVDDFAEACLHLLKNWYPNKNDSPLDENGNPLNWINVGCDFEISIKDLAYKISKIMQFDGDIIWDLDKPDGTPRKKLDTNYINNLGWQAKTNIDEGIVKTISSYKNNF